MNTSKLTRWGLVVAIGPLLLCLVAAWLTATAGADAAPPPTVAGVSASAPGEAPHPSSRVGPAVSLTASQIAQATRIAQGDAQLAQIVGPQQLTMGRVVPLYDEQQDLRLGAAVQFSWHTPVDIGPGLPLIVASTSPTRPYDSIASTIAVKGVTSIWAFVDLIASRVVELLPGSYA